MYRIPDFDELTIQNNFLFQKVMRNTRLCKHLIEKILGITITHLEFPLTEKTIDARLDAKSIRLDVYVIDDTGRAYDIECQVTEGKDGELAKRTRYYQALMDMDLLEKGQTYDKLNDSYIIFICTFDLFNRDLPMYTFRNICLEEDFLSLGDGATKVFLNSKGNTNGIDPDIAAFLQYINTKKVEGAFVEAIDQEVRNVKLSENVRLEYMTLAMEIDKARNQERMDMLLRMLQNRLGYEIIANVTQYSIPQIKEIAREHHIPDYQ